MPSMASVTVKKNDGTTDIIYDALSASAGDTVPAQWRQDTGNSAIPTGLRPLIKMVSQSNGPKTARRVRISGVFPFTYTDSTTGLVMSNDMIPISLEVVLPGKIPSANKNEAISQFTNFCVATLIRSCIQAEFAAT